MSQTLDLNEFYLNGRANVVLLECLEIYHPSFSQTYRIVNASMDGYTVKHEDGQEYHYDYYPCRIVKNGLASDLDSGIRVDWGELGEIIPNEIENAVKNNQIKIEPKVTYRMYRHDVPTYPLEGPYFFQIVTISRKVDEGASFEAKAESLNNCTTGEVFDLERFPSLRDFLY